jgi:hypothetical protein
MLEQNEPMCLEGGQFCLNLRQVHLSEQFCRIGYASNCSGTCSKSLIRYSCSVSAKNLLTLRS